MLRALATLCAEGQRIWRCGFVPWLSRGFRHQKLYRQDFVCLFRHGHPRLVDGLDAVGYQREAHVVISRGTGADLIADAVSALGIERRALLEVPGVLGLPAVLAATDLVATLPRHIGETLARTPGLDVADCPLEIPGFFVRQTWHLRHEDDLGHRWLRGVVSDLFLDPEVGQDRT